MKQLKDYLLLRPGDTNENVFKENVYPFGPTLIKYIRDKTVLT